MKRRGNLPLKGGRGGVRAGKVDRARGRTGQGEGEGERYSRRSWSERGNTIPWGKRFLREASGRESLGGPVRSGKGARRGGGKYRLTPSACSTAPPITGLVALLT